MRDAVGSRMAASMRAAEIKLLHFRIGFDLFRPPLLEDTAIVHHGYAFDDAQRDVHVVLDDDVADMLRQGRQDFDQLLPLGRRQAGCRLIEQNEARRAGERERDFELALLAVAQFRNTLILHIRQMYRLDESERRLHQSVVAPRPQHREASARDAPAGEIDVVDHREAGEQRRNLVGAAQAAANALVRREARHVLAEEADGAGTRREVARDAIKERGLAGAVGAEHGAALARAYAQCNVGQCRKRAEHAGHTAQMERIGGARGGKALGDGGHHGRASPFPGRRSRSRRCMRARSRCHSPSTPSGEKNTTARKPNPTASLNRSPAIPNARRISDANTLSSAYMSAPINGPIGCARPPTTAITRMSITCGMPAVPGTTWAFCQTSRMPPTAAIALANE